MNYYLQKNLRAKISLRLKKYYVLHHPDRAKYNFIHINKCGGTSVYTALGQKYKLHDLAIERKIQIGNAWGNAFNFSIVRNPYARLISLYRYQVHKGYIANTVDTDFETWLIKLFLQPIENENKKWRMYLTQCAWIMFDNKFLLDRVYKLEELPLFWNEILSNCKKSYRPLKRLNSLATNEDYNLTSNEQNIINKVFAHDFEVLKYPKRK